MLWSSLLKASVLRQPVASRSQPSAVLSSLSFPPPLRLALQRRAATTMAAVSVAAASPAHDGSCDANPGLAEALRRVGSRRFELDRDFRVVTQELGQTYAAPLPIFHTTRPVVNWDADDQRGPTSREDYQDIEGAFLARNILSPGECAQLIAASE